MNANKCSHGYNSRLHTIYLNYYIRCATGASGLRRARNTTRKGSVTMSTRPHEHGWKLLTKHRPSIQLVPDDPDELLNEPNTSIHSGRWCRAFLLDIR